MIARYLVMIALAASVACATARDNAVTATNTAQDVLRTVDDVWAPIVQLEIARAKPLDDAQYKQHIAPYLVVTEALEQARYATQLLNLAVQTWDSQTDGGSMWRDVVPCVEQDLQLVRALLVPHQKLVPEQVTQALEVVQGALHVLSPNATCKSKRSVEPVPLAQPLASTVDGGAP